MDFSLPAGAFAKAVETVKGCIPTRTTIPILSHVLITGRAGAIDVRGTNLEMEAIATSGADVADDGEIAIPGEILAGIVKRMPKSELVTVKQIDDRADVRCGTMRYSLRLLPNEDFPRTRDAQDDGVTFTIACTELRGLLEATRYALLNSEDRPYLQGVFLHVADGQLAAAASDGHRLARRLCALPGGAADMPGVIVPGNAVREIVAMLEEGDATVTVGESLIRISVPDLTFSSSLIGSTFPPYDRLISFERQPEITVHPRVMIEAIERALVLYQGTDIKMPAAIFRAADGKLNMDAGAARFDTGSEEIEATIHASDARFRCNVKYLAEMLKVWPADVDLDIQTNNDGPILFTAGDAPDMTHIIMPQHKG